MNDPTLLQNITDDLEIRRVATECLALKRDLLDQMTARDLVIRAMWETRLENRLSRDAVLLSLTESREDLVRAIAELRANRTAVSLGMIGL
jgi:hypothetical protein